MGKDLSIRRVTRTAAALGIVVGIVLGAGLGVADAASAATGANQTACAATPTQTTCLGIWDAGSGYYDVQAGITVPTSGAIGPHQFSAEVRSNDPGDPVLAVLPLQEETSGPGFVSADFGDVLPCSVLDEDPGPADDEIHVRIELVDQQTNTTRLFRTGTVVIDACA